jgi:hypothetical protein
MMITFNLWKKRERKRKYFTIREKKHPQKVDMMKSINIEYPLQMQKVK